MPIVSVCPYCSRGRVRLSEESIGTFTRCPSCGADFAAIPNEEPVETTASSQDSSSFRLPAVVAEEPPPRPRPKRTDPTPVESPDAETLPDARPLRAEVPDPDDLPDPARLPAMIAVAVAFAGVVVWMIPDFGRLIWLLFAVISAAVAGWSFLAADRKKLFAWIALGTAGGSLLLCLVLPMLFGEGWWPTRGYNADEAVALGFDGQQRDGREEIDVTKADWFKDGVRVRVVRIRQAGVTVTIPAVKNKKPTRQTVPDVFQIDVEVWNDGAPRPPLFSGWTAITPAVLLTAADTPVPAKAFDAPPDGGPPTTPRVIPTGLSAVQTLYFEPPPIDAGGSGILELPVTAFGGSGEPIRLMVPLRPYTRPDGGIGGAK